ncbi:MAG: L-serine ammonia-lyase, iron-sulfur-dependent, subunit alpha [Ardenticatenaceae bacterium]|nr:L-serine ammonia-lyase, iron-sulfur-dependent, subunit alpha [Ardenticatenaceae bacterium]
MAVSSIFNDAIGPVMRGPSSSHSAAGCRIGLLLRDLIAGDIEKVVIDYDPNGSLVTTHESQGTDMGLYGGLLGWQADDARMESYRDGIQAAGITIQVNYLSYGATHPNMYRISVSNAQIAHMLTAISTGGGMIEVQQIDGAAVSMNGDYHELLIYGRHLPALQSNLPATLPYDFLEHHSGDRQFIELKSAVPFSAAAITAVEALPDVDFVRYLRPVLPILSRKDLEVPFIYCRDMVAYGRRQGLSLWELALRYESARGGISENEVCQKMSRLVQLMDNSIQQGLQGTYYEDRILPCQSVGFKERMSSQSLINGEPLNTIILYVTAMMEIKSSMGVIVAAPTAGSCGALPGAILGAAAVMGKSEEDVVHAMLAAGMIGVFISEHATFSAEVGGCQAECGAGSAMAAAGLVVLAGGTLEQSVAAASLALQNSLGMICDPIGKRVEAPCLGRNVMAASNALSCANMALANYDPLIALDEVISTMLDVGNSISHELRCTGLGGLAITPSAIAIEKRLHGVGNC